MADLKGKQLDSNLVLTGTLTIDDIILNNSIISTTPDYNLIISPAGTGIINATKNIAISVSDTNVSTNTNMLNVYHNITGTPSAGIGVSITGYTHSLGSTYHKLFEINSSFTNVSAGSEDSDIIFRNRDSDVFLDCMRMKAKGTVIIPRGEDASVTADGFLQLGEESGVNLVIDNNEILARNNGSVSTPLYLQNDGGTLLSGAIYNTTTASSANVNVASDGTLARSTCGEYWKENIRDFEINTSGLYDISIKTFEEKSNSITGHSIIADANTFAALPNAVIKGNVKKKNENGSYKKDQEGNYIYEAEDIYDALNWNFIVTAMVVEMKKLQDRIIVLESKV